MICLATLLADELNDRLYLVFGETRNLQQKRNQTETNPIGNKGLRDPCYKCPHLGVTPFGGTGVLHVCKYSRLSCLTVMHYPTSGKKFIVEGVHSRVTT